MSDPRKETAEQPVVSPSVSTDPGRGPWRLSRIPSHVGRARTSTLVLSVLFLAIGALYLQIRPEVVETPTPVSDTDTVQPAPTTTAPTRTPTSEPTTTASGTPTESAPTTTAEPTPTSTEESPGTTTPEETAETSSPAVPSPSSRPTAPTGVNPSG
jgi:hypothetical protein